LSLKKTTIPYSLLLALTALIWGLCFVAQRSGMDFIGPFLFNGLRELLGSLTLLVILAGMLIYNKLVKVNMRNKTSELTAIAGHDASDAHDTRDARDARASDAPNARASDAPDARAKRALIIRGGLACGLVLFMASNAQQIGMISTTAGKAAFITTLYIVLVPVVGIALRHKTRWNTWVSVVIAVVGLYLLCVNEGFGVEAGDLVLILSALFWAFHILAVDHFVPTLGIREVFVLCALQFFVAGGLSLLASPLFDPLLVNFAVRPESVIAVLPEVVYAGVLSTGVAFTLAAVGQKHIRPAAASLLMSLEAPFGLLGGVVLLAELLSGREVVGCILMFLAVVLAQMVFKRRKSPAGQGKM
jgi:drug/metabolite transporter (DMT)-like permease